MRKYIQFTLPALLCVALFGITFFSFILPRVEEEIMSKKRETTRELVQTIIQLLKTYQDDVDKGIISIETAQADVLKRIRSIRYGPEMKDYFWINDMTPRMIMNPYRPDIDNQDLTNFKDLSGKKIFVELVREATKADGGFIEYLWQHHDNPNIVTPKLSYVFLFKPWGWIIGSGLYYDDVLKGIDKLTRIFTSVGLVVCLLVAALSGFITWRGVVEIKEKERVLASLEENEAKYRTLFDATNDIILLMDDEVIIDCNHSASELYHTEIEDIIGRTPYDFSPEFQSDSVPSKTLGRQYINKAKNNEPQHFEWINQNVDKAPRYTDVFLKKITLLGKELLMGVCRDVTGQRQAQEALRRNAALLKAAGRVAKVGGWSIDIANQTITWSDEVALMHEKAAGYSPTVDEATQFIAPEWYNKIQKSFVDCMDQGIPINEEFEIITASGNRLWVKSSCEIINNESGEIIQIQGALQDITSQKKTEENLRQAQKTKAIGTLAAGIAHDFNNVLWGILGFSEMAMFQIDESPQEAKYSIEKVIESGNRAKYIIQQILQFSRQSEIAMGPLDLATLVKEVVKLLQATVPSNFEIRLTISKGIFRVHADATQIHQVLMNLCTNAHHAMQEKKKGILSITLDRVKTESEIKCHTQILTAGDYICLNITDTGHGIDPAYTDKIFDPYYTTKKKGERTGLGLSVSFGIIQSHNGGIKVESRKGVGTTFTIFLPPKVDDVVEVVSVNEKIQGGKERILFVDDEGTLSEMMEKLLRNIGYSVISFDKSPEALDYFSSHPDRFDLVITDQTMPRLLGLEFANKIRKIRPIPVILCTGFSETITEDDLKRNGVSIILKKPLLRKEVANAIRNVLDEV